MAAQSKAARQAVKSAQAGEVLSLSDVLLDCPDGTPQGMVVGLLLALHHSNSQGGKQLTLTAHESGEVTLSCVDSGST